MAEANDVQSRRITAADLIELEGAYALSGDAVLVAAGSSAEGLTGREAAARLTELGPNALPEAPPTPAWKRYLGQFNDVLIYILLVSALLKLIMSDWVEFGVIVVAVIAIGTVGYVQEGKADRALASIKSMLAEEAQVVRQGEWTVVPVEHLVVGDVVRLRSGDRVPADVRLLQVANLRVDESALTGESVPVEKSAAPSPPSTGVGDRIGMGYSGTLVTSGTATAVVTGTGTHTQLGHITTLVGEVQSVDTPLTKQMAHLGKQISILIAIMAVIMLLVGTFVHHFSLDELISATISFAVAAVPEGLPALVTITLAIGVQQMAKRRAVARKMEAIEALGAVDTICSDKTGTLTQNEMTVTTIHAGDRKYATTGIGYNPEGTIEPALYSPALEEMLVAAGLVGDAKLQENGGEWTLVGEPTEGAMATLVAKSGADLAGYRRLQQVPFESAHKFSASLDTDQAGKKKLHVMGAPDRLLARSTRQMRGDGETQALDLDRWERRMAELSGQGLRLLGVAYRDAENLTQVGVEDARGLTFLGLVGIVDPPRPEARQAIFQAHAAGVNVKMITGDHVGTATAIAADLGIGKDHRRLQALTGAELEGMSDLKLAEVAREVDVYARTSPEHKIRIVAALQSHGEVVAMTGDGVNDAPSIAQADVGVAMGIKGTEVTKEAAEIVLQDDNFATIIAAVEEGRRIYDNIRKSVAFMLPTNGAQSLVILVAVMLGWALPLSPSQILWINLVTAVTLSLPLALEPAEPNVMVRPPREPNEQILSGKTFWLVVWVSVLIGAVTLLAFQFAADAGANYALAQTTALNVLAFAQLAYLFNCRVLSASSFTSRAFTGNRGIWYAAGALVALQLLLIYLPILNALFGTVPLGVRQWVFIASTTVTVFLVVEIIKAMGRLRTP